MLRTAASVESDLFQRCGTAYIAKNIVRLKPEDGIEKPSARFAAQSLLLTHVKRAQNGVAKFAEQ